MEILTSTYAPCSPVMHVRWKVVGKYSCVCPSKLTTYRRAGIICAARINRGSGSLRFQGKDKFVLECLDNRPCVGSSNGLDGLQEADTKLKGVNYDTYVVDGSEDVGGISRSGEQSNNILIPGLPDASAGEREASINSSFWEWKPKLSVYYEKAGPDNVKSPPVLFLPGFGVGSFHYEKQLKDLGCEYRVWAMDFLGQGLSLPVEDPTALSKGEHTPERDESSWGFGNSAEPWASQLSFSVDLWRDQVQYFIEEVIGEPVYLVGNSLGGFVALYFAASHPHLVKGVTLLNATPFWGFLPNPIRSPRLASIFPWSGTFPLPNGVKKLTEILLKSGKIEEKLDFITECAETMFPDQWQKISDPGSIAEILKQVYADHSTDVDNVFSRILEITEHPAAAASFASIMFAPQGQFSFGESLSRCKANNIPICLMYGKEDPWVKPIWGLQVKRQVPEAPYYEISPAGHCPHDEVPEVVNYLLRGWINHLESKQAVVLPLLKDIESAQHNTAKELEFMRDGSRKSVRVQFRGSVFSLWNWMRSYFSSQFRRLEAK